MVIIYSRSCTIKKDLLWNSFKKCVSFLNIRLLGFHLEKTNFWLATGGTILLQIVPCTMLSCRFLYQLRNTGDCWRPVPLFHHFPLCEYWYCHKFQHSLRKTQSTACRMNILELLMCDLKNLLYNFYFCGVFYNILDQ